MKNEPKKPMRFYKEGDKNSRKKKDLISYLRSRNKKLFSKNPPD